MQETFWNLYARWYDRLTMLFSYQELQALVLAELGDMPSDARMLDVACGTGELFIKLVKRFPKVQIVGIERSASMARQARRKLDALRARQSLGYGSSILELDLNNGLLDSEGWKNASFDAIVSVNTLYVLDEPELFLHECRRLLAPGGRIVIVNPWVPEPQRVLLDHLQRLKRMRDIRGIAKFVLASPEIGVVYAINAVIAKRAKSWGNTIIVVEHDEDTIFASDYLVDIGPGAGV